MQNRAVTDLVDTARIRQDQHARAAGGPSHTLELLAQNGVLRDIINRTKPATWDF